MSIVKITSGLISLSSGLSQESFSKTNMASMICEKGFCFHVSGENVSFEEFTFDGTATDGSGFICFEGKSFNGILLSEILEKKSDFSENDIFSLKEFFKAIDFIEKSADFDSILSKSDVALGAGGIVINADFSSQKADVLFLPAELFEACVQNHKESCSDLQGKYLYKGLSPRLSILFLRGAVAYKALTGRFPFEESDTSRRQEDIFDKNFIPVGLRVKNLGENLSDSIDSALSLSVKNEIVAGKRTISDIKSQKDEQKKFENAKNFDSEEFERVLKSKKTDFDDSELAKKREKFQKSNRLRIFLRRFLRRNKNRFLAGFAFLFVGFWLLSGIFRENSRLVTTVSLTSTETTHALYSMIHRADVPNLQEIVSGKETKDLLLKISGLFVSSRQRLESTPDNKTVSPAEWFFYKNSGKIWMYGITNLKIDGKDFPALGKFPKNKDKPSKIIEENGKNLQKGDETAHTAEYFLVRQAENRISAEKMTDTVTLRWNGKKWQVVKVEGKSKPAFVKSKSFSEEYFSLLEESRADSENESIKNALETLRERYEWIPGEEDFTAAAIHLQGE